MPSEMHTTLTCEIVGMSWTRQVPGCKRTPRDKSVAESGPETVQNGLLAGGATSRTQSSVRVMVASGPGLKTPVLFFFLPRRGLDIAADFRCVQYACRSSARFSR